MDSAASRSWRWPILAVVVAAASCAAPHSSSAGPTDDVQEVRTAVAAYERAWNTHDASALAAFFSEDADMLFGNGPLVRGRPAIRKWWSAYFDHLDDGRRGAFPIDSIRSIARDVVLVNVDSKTSGRSAEGRELPTRRARGTWVVVRQPGGWRISALRGFPAEGEIRSAPGADR